MKIWSLFLSILIFGVLSQAQICADLLQNPKSQFINSVDFLQKTLGENRQSDLAKLSSMVENSPQIEFRETYKSIVQIKPSFLNRKLIVFWPRSQTSSNQRLLDAVSVLVASKFFVQNSESGLLTRLASKGSRRLDEISERMFWLAQLYSLKHYDQIPETFLDKFKNYLNLSKPQLTETLSQIDSADRSEFERKVRSAYQLKTRLFLSLQRFSQLLSVVSSISFASAEYLQYRTETYFGQLLKVQVPLSSEEAAGLQKILNESTMTTQNDQMLWLQDEATFDQRLNKMIQNLNQELNKHKQGE